MKRDASTEQSGELPRGCYLNEIVYNLAKKSKVLPSRKNTYTMNRGGNKKELIFWGGTNQIIGVAYVLLRQTQGFMYASQMPITTLPFSS